MRTSVLLNFVFGLSPLLLLTGCPPSNSSAPQPATSFTVATLPAKAQVCEKNLREKMLAHSIGFQHVDGAPDKTESSSDSVLLTSSVPSYGATQINGVISALQLSHNSNSGDEKFSLSYSISQPPEGSPATLRFNISSNDLTIDRDLQVTQDFNVDDSCTLSVTYTSVTIYKRLSAPNRFSYKSNEIYIDGQMKEDSGTFSIPKDGKLSQFTKGLESNVYSFDSSVGLMKAITEDQPDIEVKEFGLDVKMKAQRIWIAKADGTKIFYTDSARNIESGLSYSKTGGEKQWQVPASVWQNLSLSQSRDLNAQIQSNLPTDYLKTHSIYLLLTPNLPSYDHLAAYWSANEIATDSATGLRVFSVTESTTGTVSGPTDASDLASNDTIQTELPEIQKTAAGIRAQQPSDRSRQIDLILQYLGTQYAYDTDMVNNNIVRAFTTEEALKRGKGVCQHYAVIYTAIARALKIPTRIVFGYALFGSSPGGHAWVESEITPGTWKVVEPQSRHLPAALPTRYYIPLARATFLEDKSADLTVIVQAFLQGNYILRPTDTLQPRSP